MNSMAQVTEEQVLSALRQVSDPDKGGDIVSLALGAPEWRTSLRVMLPAAASGVLTGIILGVARIAGEAAPRSRDEAFIAALLADIGIPILAEALPKAYRKLVEQHAPHGRDVTADEERQYVQVTHGEVSAMVLGHWTLPDPICQAVNLHQSINPGEGLDATLARILHASDRIARLLCEVTDQHESAMICRQALDIVGLDTTMLFRVLPTIERDIEELADALRIDVVASQCYALVAESLQKNLMEPAAP